MTKELADYDVNTLARESLNDPPGYSAREAILTSKCLLKLKESITDLQSQIPLTISELRQTITKNTRELNSSITDLSKEIKSYSTSSERYAKLMKWLTGALVFFTAVQALGIIVSLFKH